MSKRMRRRYLALRIMSEQPVNKDEIIDAVWNAVLQLFGEYGASQTSLTFIEHDSEKNYAVVRCSHKAVERVKASIASITEINEKPVAIHVLGVSGTLKALRRRILP